MMRWWWLLWLVRGVESPEIFSHSLLFCRCVALDSWGQFYYSLKTEIDKLISGDLQMRGWPDPAESSIHCANTNIIFCTEEKVLRKYCLGDECVEKVTLALFMAPDFPRQFN